MTLSIHDADFCRAARARADTLRSASQRQWGKMSVDQMVWHVNSALSLALGRLDAAPDKAPLPTFLLVPLVLYAPWPKAKAPALRELIAKDSYDLEAERQRFHVLIEEVAAKPLDASWISHPTLGRLTGAQWSRLQAKHVDHHFRQFSV